MGAGAWGSALSMLLFNNGHQVTVYSTNIEKIKQINKNRINKCLPYVKIPKEIIYTNNFFEISKFDFILIALPSNVINNKLINLIKKYKAYKCKIIIASKGMYGNNINNIMTLSQLFKKQFDSNQICVITGPTHAEEIAINLPSAFLIASENYNYAKKIVDLFKQRFLNIYITTDILGAELGGSLKNIIAIAAGLSDGLKLGDNFKAALITRGLNEIINLGKKIGALEKTFMGLSGLGDIIVTCNSIHSRNYQAGLLIAKQMSKKEILIKIGATIEGYYAIQSAIILSQKYSVDLPITYMLNKIINKSLEAKNIINIFDFKINYSE